MKSLHWVVFGVMCAAQLAVPVYMITSREEILEYGASYKFRCGPVDPYDAFRGRYVALSFPNMQIDNWKGEYLDGSEDAYAALGVDEEGFAKITDVTLAPPVAGDYLRVTAYGGGTADSTLRVNLPFDRYYMDEFQAPEAEVAYRAQSRTEEGAHAVIRVQDGEGVVEGLYFGDKSVEEYLREEAAKPVTETPPQ